MGNKQTDFRVIFYFYFLDDGESGDIKYKAQVYSQEERDEGKSIPFKTNSFEKQMSVYENDNIEPLVDVLVISETEYKDLGSGIYDDDEFSLDDSAGEVKLNRKFEVEENRYNCYESSPENSSGSGLDVGQSDVSQLEEASGSSNQTTVSHGSSGTMSQKSSPYENVTFEYSDIQNSRFQIRKVKDTLPRITREKSVLKVKKRYSSKRIQDYMNFEWDFGSSDQLNDDKFAEKDTMKNNAVSVIKKHEPTVTYDSDGKSENMPIPGSSYDSPSSGGSLLFDVNGNSCNDTSSKRSVDNKIADNSDTENCFNKKSSLSKRSGKRSKTPWIFGQHKNPVVVSIYLKIK